MSKFAGSALLVTGFLACPCHLVFTLPLMTAALVGTALGAFLSENAGLMVTVSTIYFIVGLSTGWPLLQRARTEGCESCEDEAPKDKQSITAAAASDSVSARSG